jgi:uncharacterized membrane protein
MRGMSTSPTAHSPDASLPSLLLGAAGGALVAGGRRQSASGTLARLAGLAMVGIAARQPVADALRRAATRRRTAHLRLSFVVPQPVSTVFRFCADFENYPKFIRALRAVQDFGDGRSHWVGWSPSGELLEWDAVTTKYLTNRVIAWRSTPASPVETAGVLRFVPERGGGTCVRVALDYCAPTERIADAVAALATRRRVGELETDILRLGEQLELDAAAAAASSVD